MTGDPAPGDLLVASVLLADGVFNQTVVLVLDCDEDGALGVILNEISQTPLDAVLPDWVSSVSEPQSALPRRAGVTQRGDLPGQRGERAGGTAGLATAVRHGRPAAPGHADRDRLRGLPRPADLRRLLRAGRPGSSRPRLAEGMWHVARAEYDDVFGDQPTELWRAVLRRQPGELAFFSTWLEDPELN